MMARSPELELSKLKERVRIPNPIAQILQRVLLVT